MKQLFKRSVFLFVAVSFLINSYVWSFGLGVTPGEIKAQGVPVGKKAALSDFLEKNKKVAIENTSDTAYVYTIEVLPTLKTTSPLKEGYKDIPDTSWIQPQNSEVKVAANSREEVEFFLSIPEKYRNENFQAVIEVKTKKNNPEDMFVLACQVQMFVSTASAKKNKRK